MHRFVRSIALALLAVTAATTIRAQSSASIVADINPGPASSGPSDLAVSNGSLYFAASDGIAGRELMRYDGSSISLAADVNPGVADSSPQHLIAFGGSVYFSAQDPAHGRELWRFDGVTASPVGDINPGAGSSNPGIAVVLAGALYFPANDGTGTQLWRWNGATLAKMRDLFGTDLGDPYNLTVIGNALFFQACNASKGCELWHYDGVSAPVVNDIVPGVYSSYPYGMTGLGNAVIFGATDGNGETEIYEYANGSAFLLKNISQSLYGSNPGGFTVFNGLLYFSAADSAINSDPAHGYELWVTDGTRNGTHLAADINQGTGSSNPGQFVVFGGALFFKAFDPDYGMELRSFDGQVVTRLGDLRNGANNSNPNRLTSLGDLLYFQANGDNLGIELWATDGGAPFLVRDINPGTGSSEPDNFTLYNGALYFSAADPAYGAELWSTSPCVPSAEVCNGLDDDCNGLVDDGTIQQTVYRDADGDGYGLAASTLLSCSVPLGWVANATDCNDANAAVHPGAAEACNNLDDNCDGQIDEGLMHTYYDDNDGDGYGEPYPFQSCDPPPYWWVANGADCDDSSMAIHPGAPQICDGFNNDCNHPNWPSLVGTNEYDDDGDGLTECQSDCNDGNGDVWAIPGEARSLAFTDKATLVWYAPWASAQGGYVLTYDTVRSSVASDFTAAACVETRDGSDTTAADATDPAAGAAFFYLVRPGNACGAGAAGTDGVGNPRTVAACP